MNEGVPAVEKPRVARKKGAVEPHEEGIEARRGEEPHQPEEKKGQEAPLEERARESPPPLRVEEQDNYRPHDQKGQNRVEEKGASSQDLHIYKMNQLPLIEERPILISQFPQVGDLFP